MASSDQGQIRLAFQGFRDDIDAYNDRRERLIKVLLLSNCFLASITLTILPSSGQP